MTKNELEIKIVNAKVKVDTIIQSEQGQKQAYLSIPYLCDLENAMNEYINCDEVDFDICCMIFKYMADCFECLPFFPKAIDAYTNALSCCVKSSDETVIGEIPEVFYNIAKLRNIVARDKYFADNKSLVSGKEKTARLYDNCEDIIEIAKSKCKTGQLRDLLNAAAETAHRSLIADKSEHTQEYFDVLYDMHRELSETLSEKETQKGFCHIFWASKKVYLKKRGIDWETPSKLNPEVKFE